MMKYIFSTQGFYILTILVLVFGAAWIWASAAPPGDTASGQIPAPQVGFLAPDFTLEDLEGNTYSLSDLRGRPILVNFWASWCPPCRAEMPAIQRTYQAYQEDGLLVLAVNAANQDSLAEASRFVEQHNLTFPILLDRDGSVSRLYEVRSLPTSFFFDREGKIRDVVVGGPMAEALLRVRAEQLLEKTP
jgi:cytochrome c biogenesis protein CcmG, thiol:disulfide interchange protein DsbE